MPNAIAFFPWVYLIEPLTVGSIRLMPFEGRRRPRGKAGELHRDIKGVLKAYAVRKNQLVKEATLLEVGDWYLGQDVADHAQQLFRARELIVFSALATRRLFQGSSDYCNFDTYAF